MGNRTPLYDRHVAAGARIVDFGGWDMPLHYGSQIDEHHAVRKSAGMFDVSHMTVADIIGRDARAYLEHLLANDVGKLTTSGRGLYSCMLNSAGGVVDDLIAYRTAENDYRLVVNAATRDKDLAWMVAEAADFSVEVREKADLIMLAVQGPMACERAAALLPESISQVALALKPFHCVNDREIFVARTGYTGEDGWEIVLDEESGLRFWDAACSSGIVPCGLGARDTLRLEAGLNLYGQDMDETTSPLVSGLGWTVAMQSESRDFVGRAALQAAKLEGVSEKLVGLILDDRGIMRHGQRVVTGAGDGIVTSGGFSPTIQCSIALARVPSEAAEQCEVEIRNGMRGARIVRPPFVRKGVIKI
jgi:aminomethyltransferase